jgi:hypothetical protein
LELFNPSRRSSSAIRAFSAADLGHLCPDQRNQFFPGRLARRFANHLTLESKPDSPVH